MNEKDWIHLSEKAWEIREHAYLFGETKVGASILSENENIYCGCNIEHRYRSHDIHAEVNAISNMISAGDTHIKKILIVAERDFFTPCGACMDWIMQFSDEHTLVGFQNERNGEIQIYRTEELMPHYPR
jgi:cytidine deaminase